MTKSHQPYEPTNASSWCPCSRPASLFAKPGEPHVSIRRRCQTRKTYSLAIYKSQAFLGEGLRYCRPRGGRRYVVQERCCSKSTAGISKTQRSLSLYIQRQPMLSLGPSPPTHFISGPRDHVVRQTDGRRIGSPKQPKPKPKPKSEVTAQTDVFRINRTSTFTRNPLFHQKHLQDRSIRFAGVPPQTLHLPVVPSSTKNM